ncbi:hypothetical protein MHM95_12415 [Pseudoalteromonas sp. CnMc7-15]|uniref:hypothetical protein n=1 Tax=Pseudoalteromonas TaxID=53246 RepID=UPI0003B4CFB1|nr:MULTISPECIES: hypothetical protein [Pseudoalteromonas]MCG7567084.1 hypothetical protein [Pseudoalteromonas sp. CnMc7-15]
MGWISKVLGFLTNPIADLTGSYRERKRIAAETAANIATAEGELKVARLKAKTRRIENQENNDTDYDLIVLKNRATSLMDEFVILVFLGLFLAHFVPSLQPYMQGGWKAMGYAGAPWYFEFAVVGILVSTLGLMRLFRVFFERLKPTRAPV